MKKFKMLKITVLFLFSLCAISLSLVTSKFLYINRKSEKIKEEIVANIEKSKEIKKDKLIDKDNGTEENKILELKNEANSKESQNKKQIGIIKIPSLGIEAPIIEGTSKEILKYTVRAL